METFSNIMNEKNCKSYTPYGISNNDDLGLVALDSQCIGNRGIKTNCGISDENLEELYNIIINNIKNKTIKEEKKIYVSYLVKLIFKIRDIKDGNGERDIFYKLLLKLYIIQPEIVKYSLFYLIGGYDFNNNNEKIDETPPGSFLDLNNLYKLCCINKNNEILKDFILNIYKNTLILDDCDELINYPSLASKWAPRESSSLNKKYFMMKKLTEKMYGNSCSDNLKKYRKLICKLSTKLGVLEKLMCSNNWDNIEIKNIPSKAFLKYIKAFKYINKDGTVRTPSKEERIRFRNKILSELELAKKNPSLSQINTKTLMPYEMVCHVINYNDSIDIEHYNSLWEKYVFDFKESLGGQIKPGLCLADVSGSMSGIPMEVCIALSILLSNIINGPLNKKVITFTEEPTWHNITGSSLKEQVDSLKSADWGGSTNFGKALNLILNTAVNNNLKQSDLPEILYVFSDMQWDEACGSNSYYKSYTDTFLTGYESIKQAYTTAGYIIPHIVFWNLRNTNNYNNKSNQKGTTMMSGFSANMFKSFLEGTFVLEATPWDTLKDILDKDRYTSLDNIISKHYIDI